MDNKHKSKLHKGFDKQCKRQDSKPYEVKIKLPIAIQLPKNFKGKYKHYFTVSNNKRNGMNLKNISVKYPLKTMFIKNIMKY